MFKDIVQTEGSFLRLHGTAPPLSPNNTFDMTNSLLPCPINDQDFTNLIWGVLVFRDEAASLGLLAIVGVISNPNDNSPNSTSIQAVMETPWCKLIKFGKYKGEDKREDGWEDEWGGIKLIRNLRLAVEASTDTVGWLNGQTAKATICTEEFLDRRLYHIRLEILD